MNRQTLATIKTLLAMDPPSAKEAQSVADAIGLQLDPPEADAVLRFGEVAKTLAVCKRSVRGYVDRGLLPVVMPAGNTRALGIPRSAVLAFMRHGTAFGSEVQA